MKVAVICGNLLVLIMDCPGGCDMWQSIDMKAVICGNVLTLIMDCTGGCDMWRSADMNYGLYRWL